MSDVSHQIQDAMTRLFRLAAQLQTNLDEGWTPKGGLPPADAWLLRTVADRGPLRLSDLAGELGVDRSTISPQVKRLEEASLLTRRQDPADRRAWDVEVTARGHALLDRIAALRAANLDRALGHWDRDDRELLARLLDRFAADMTHQAAANQAAPGTGP